MSAHFEEAEQILRRLDRGYDDSEWAQVDATKALAEATVALVEEQRRANQIALLAVTGMKINASGRVLRELIMELIPQAE
jgi:hypothetical protein